MNESKSDASVSVDEGVLSSEIPPSEPISSSNGPVPISQVPQSLRVGTLIDGRWRLLRVIGVGGTATVYEAEDRSSPAGAHVAVKALHRDCAGNAEIRSRFLREAYLANKVQHPAVVSVLGDGVIDNIPFIVMELLEGETLDARWERKGKRLDVAEVLWAIDKLLDVLVAAHAKGIVHRDIKPENIFLTTNRQLKVLDFGLARLFEGVGYDQSRTQIGFVMGTPAFMPPEQAKGRWDQVGVQTDLWSVGATMFCLLSGRLVHEGTQILEVVEAATTKAAPSLGQVAPHMPREVIDLVDFALAFEMERRWPNARIMKLAVRKAYVSLTAPEESPNSEQDSADQLQRGNLVDALGLPSPPLSMRSPSVPKMRPDLDAIPAPEEPGVPSSAAPVSKHPSAITLPSALGAEEMSRSSGKLAAAEIARGEHSDEARRPSDRPAEGPRGHEKLTAEGSRSGKLATEGSRSSGKLAAEASRSHGKLATEGSRSHGKLTAHAARSHDKIAAAEAGNRTSSKQAAAREGSLAGADHGPKGPSEAAPKGAHQRSPAVAPAQPSVWAWLAAASAVAALLVVVYFLLRKP